MKKYLLFAVGAIAIISNLTVIVMAQSRAGNVIYRPPQGWHQLEQNGSIVFVPNDRPLNQAGAFLAILPGQELQGDFRATFDNAVKASLAGARVTKGGDVTATNAEEGYPVLFTILVSEDSAGKSAFRFYLACNPGNRFEMVAFIATNADDFQRYRDTLDTFIRNMDFANRHEPKKGVPNVPSAAPRPASGNALTGLYVATESRQQFNPVTKYYDYIVRRVYYLFAPDGRVYYGLPKDGNFNNFDFARAAREDAANVGSYQINGNQLQFSFQGRNNPPVAFTRTQNGFRLGNTVYYRVSGFDGLRLNGTYSIRSFTNTSAGNNTTGGVAGERVIAFSGDGRFSEQGFVGFSGSGASAGAAGSSRNSGSGSYQIRENTLELNYADGRRERYSFFVYPENVNENPPGLIIINGGAFLLRK